ncbi:hypothetical protein NDN08_007719 [Rhodosorus marinus]|uniref:Amine oxidase domain-containing protein n=1 Tax=Rhodosorus marinus TaxID=101924 RepID=A0AAV8UYC0_9RHOD|nr:hypothetical protein NDN08_007719 [Rhodosorus marinus]
MSGAFVLQPFQYSRKLDTCRCRCSTSSEAADESDIVVIGSGVGGLGAAALFAKDGYDVTVLESHLHPGGAAHAFSRGQYVFDSGPSLYTGMSFRPSSNPLAHLLDSIGEDVEWIRYSEWGVNIPEGCFRKRVGAVDIQHMLQTRNKSSEQGRQALDQWNRLWKRIDSLSKASRAVPTAAVRTDPLAAVTVSRYLPRVLSSLSSLPFLTRPFSEIMDAEKVDDPLLRNWIDLLCFLLSGLPANGTPTVEAAFMLGDFYSAGAVLDYPRGGSGELVEALARGVTKRGGRIMLGHHVDSVLVENNRATGVRTTTGKVFRAKELVVSNASCWDMARLLQNDLADDSFNQWNRSLSDTPECRSFMHLHLGFDLTGLGDLLCHYIHVFDWNKGIDAEGNVVLISIPSVLDPSLAPEGKHVLHAYTPASEPYDAWAGLKKGSPEYVARKEERAGVIWKALEEIVPDIRSRVDVEMIGTPLTHEKFLRRSRGSYGPAIRAGQEMFPFAETPVEHLIRCGDSVFPGIGLPAVAAGALIAANSRSSILSHLALLDEIGL